jgi:tRNA dimethylallyltransferase
VGALAHLPLVPFLLGPTAAGKSALALTVAQALGAELIVADSVQVYRGLDIGSAKPSPEERAAVPHHGLDLVEPDQPFDAAAFRREAFRAMAGIQARGRLPIVVGGTGFYVRALLRWQLPGPGRDPALRERLRAAAAREGLGALHARLAEADPDAAARIHPHDAIRIVRALEILEATGERPSDLRGARGEGRPPFRPLLIGLHWPREGLYRRIDARVERMIARGLVAEVAGLLDRGFAPELKPLQSIGYRQIVAHLQGRFSLEAAVHAIQQATRRFAKRQLTWFRREPGIRWLRLDGEGWRAEAAQTAGRWIREAAAEDGPRAAAG